MSSNKIIEKSEVREYFNGTGFDRWNIVVVEDIDEGEELTLKYKLYAPKKI